MPLLTIHVDQTIETERKERLTETLPSVRDLLCREFNVDASFCQLAVIEARGLADQARIAVEIRLLPKPERTRDLIISACEKLRGILLEATGERAAIRAFTLDPDAYIVLR
ncbi:hypothetical protein ACFFJ7_10940 [Pseudochelatococcus lubricantis]|uniref:hypothetical protein n=1 Tax=Pseudochelatococcus lubricantis TaxID=1538102 RepID=UPI0035ED0D03